MAHTVSQAGNVLLARTLDDLALRGFVLCDIQLLTDHTLRLGAWLVDRAEFDARLRRPCRAPARCSQQARIAVARELAGACWEASPEGTLINRKSVGLTFQRSASFW